MLPLPGPLATEYDRVSLSASVNVSAPEACPVTTLGAPKLPLPVGSVLIGATLMATT